MQKFSKIKFWHHGDTVVIREIDRFDGTVVAAIPSIAISDEADLLVLYIPRGTTFKNNWFTPPEQRVASLHAIVPSAQRPYRDLIWRTNHLRLYLSGYSYSIWLKFDENGTFKSWYGNLEAPYLRTSIGIDTRDFALDIVGDPNGHWQWKDEDEFNHRLIVGIDSPEHQTRVRAAGWDFIKRFEQQEWPFDCGWENFQLPQEWQARSLPDNWTVDFGSQKILSTYI